MNARPPTGKHPPFPDRTDAVLDRAIKPPVFSARLEGDVLADNHRRAWMLALVVFLVQIPLLAIDIVRLAGGVLSVHDGYRYLWYLHLWFQGLLALLLVLLHRYRGAAAIPPTRWSTAIVMFGAVTVLLTAAGITVVDQLIHGQATVVLVGAIGVAVAVYLPLPLSVAMFGSVALVTVLALARVQPDGDVFVGHALNITLVTAIAVAANVTLYRRSVQNTLQLRLITDQRQELIRLAWHDELTGLANRRHGEHRLAEEMDRFRRYGRPFALSICDIDRFKSINDRFSHGAGDLVLRRVADLLVGQLRSVDLVARYGGEEFLVLLPETTGGAAVRVCEKLREAVRSAGWTSLAAAETVTMSFGVADTGDAEDVGALLRIADSRLYRAKALGRDSVVGDDGD